MKNIINKLFGDYPYITVPVLFLLVIVPTDIVYNYLTFIESNFVATVNATLIGFLVTGFSILMTMKKPEVLKKDNQIELIKKYLFNSFSIGIAMFFISLLLILTTENIIAVKIAIYSFIWGCISTMYFAYGLIRLGKKSFLQ